MQDHLPVENVIHRTASRPFSLHHTEIDNTSHSALYIHCHPEAEFLYLEEGTLEVHVENKSFLLHSGDAIFIPPNLIHSADFAKDCPGCSFRALVFSLAMLEEQFLGYGQTYFQAIYNNRTACVYPILMSRREDKALLTCVSTIVQLGGFALETYELRLRGLLLEAWQELYHLCLAHLATDSAPHISPGLQYSLDYMQDHYGDAILLETLAGVSGYSVSHFSHSFKALTGCAPFTYLNQIRIIKSGELLRNTDKKITDIASACGFDNISYYNRTFRKIMGTTPSKYRNN